ncbi:MAG: UPF0175 family protein [Dinghuibacter sp.]|nr:UPF0175 family protein [Dinghuibacter sp.]
MKTLTLQIPDNVPLDEQEAKMMLASRLYEKGILSMGQAAEMAGYSKRTFMELLGKYNVSVFNYPIEELENDIRNAKNYNL